MAPVLGRFMGLIYVGVVLLLMLGSATPAFSLYVNTSSSTCSSQCESKNCIDPFNLRYGKYCGIGYSGCPGQQPCDGLDACCETHDHCIGSNIDNYFNRTCNDNLKSCATNFGKSGGAQFTGSNCSATAVEGVIIAAMDVATAGHGNPTSPINLAWVTISVLILFVVLHHS